MIIQSTRVYFEEKLQPRQIVIEDGKIKEVLPYGLVEGAKDYGDLLILPMGLAKYVASFNFLREFPPSSVCLQIKDFR